MKAFRHCVLETTIRVCASYQRQCINKFFYEWLEIFDIITFVCSYWLSVICNAPFSCGIPYDNLEVLPPSTYSIMGQ